MAPASDTSSSVNCSGLPSRACSTPSSEVSDPFDAVYSNAKRPSRCHFPVLDSTEETAALGKSIAIWVDKQVLLSSRYEQFGKGNETLFHVAWLLLLQTYTGQDSVAYDVLLSDKSKTLQLKYHLDPDQRVNDILQGVDKAKNYAPTAGSKTWQDTDAFSCNTACITPAPLSQTDDSFILKYDLLLGVTKSEVGPEAILIYNSSALGKVQAESIGNTFRTIVTSILELQNPRISSITRLSSEDQRQIAKWNQHKPPLLKQQLHHVFSEKALDNPNSLAVRAIDGDLTYCELDEASTALASHISGLFDAGRCDTPLVPLFFERSKYAIIAILAILKTGSTCVPMTCDEIDEDSWNACDVPAADIICVSESQASRLANSGEKIVVVGPQLINRLVKAKSSFKPLNCKNGIAFIFPTAASEPPKGVMHSHAALYTDILTQSLSLGYNDDSITLQYAPYTSLVSVSELFGAFLYSAPLVVTPDERIDDLAAFINANDVTHAFLPTNVAKHVHTQPTPSLVCTVVLREADELGDIEAWSWSSRFVHARSIVEVSALCAISRHDSPNGFLHANMGKAIAASTWVVNPANIHELVPIGAVGQLLVGGPTLANGYLSDEPAAEHPFVTNLAWLPEGMDGGTGRIFCTRYLVRYLETGELVICGRLPIYMNWDMNKGCFDS